MVSESLQKRILAARGNKESGIAMITVVVFMILGGLMTSVLLSIALANTANTTGQRLGVEAQGASDAGIERVVAWLDGRSVTEPATGIKTKRTYADIINGALPPYTTFQVGDFTVELEYTYRVLDNFRLERRDTLSPTDNPVALIVKSTATPIGGKFSEARIASRVTVAEIALTRDPVGFDKAIFNGGSSTFTISNDMKILASADAEVPDGHVYSNGNINCMTQVDVEGTIYAQGGITMNNNCRTLNTIWADGNVILQDGNTINGDVYATGNVTFQNNEPAVKGHIIANGDVNIGFSNLGQPRHRCNDSGTQRASVCGSVLSYNGNISGWQGGRILRDAVARNNVTFSSPYDWGTSVGGYVYAIDGNVRLDDSSVGGDIRAGGTTEMSTNGSHFNGKNATGTSCQNGATMFSTNCAASGLTRQYPQLPAAGDGSDFPEGLMPLKADGSIDWQNPAGVQPPPRDADWGANGMPRINAPQAVSADPDAEDTGEQTFDPWDTWTIIKPATCAEAKTILRNGAYVNETVLWIPDCELSFNNGDTITLVGDLAIMSTRGFRISNGNGVNINATVQDPNMFWIVPADATTNTGSAVWPEDTLPPGSGSTCSAGNISLDNPKVGNPSPFRWMLYSPCTVHINNQIGGVWRGQIYGGSVSVPNNSKFQMDMVPVPSEPRVPEPGDPINAKITARYNLVYGL